MFWVISNFDDFIVNFYDILGRNGANNRFYGLP